MNLRAEQKDESISRLKLLVKELGGYLLEDPRIDSQNRTVRFACKEGHVWSGDFYRTLNGTWCPKCATSSRLRPSYEKILMLARQNRGECLTPFDDYRGINVSRMNFRCDAGHEWTVGPMSVINGHWCLTCSSLKRRVSFADIKKAAAKHGYKCLSTEYGGYDSPLRFLCPNGHEVSTRPASVVSRGIRCMECHLDRGKSKMLARLRSIAKAKRGRMLSPAYAGWNEPHLFECEQGHRWEVAAGGVANGAWCQECYFEGMRLGIEELHAVAKAKGGELLAKEYLGTQVPHLWRCDKGHEFEASLCRIRLGAWCRICHPLRNSKLSLEQMQKWAAERGGSCLSIAYINSQTHLKWQCSEGHSFMSKPNWVQQGNWCPKCAGRGWQRS